MPWHGEMKSSSDDGFVSRLLILESVIDFLFSSTADKHPAHSRVHKREKLSQPRSLISACMGRLEVLQL